MRRHIVRNRCILPAGYLPLFALDLQRDRRLLLSANALSLGVAAALIFLADTPLSALVDRSAGLLPVLLRCAALPVGLAGCLLLRGLLHAALQRMCGGAGPRCGPAYAGSGACLTRTAYAAVALVPVALPAVVLAVLGRLVPPAWFWAVYGVQVIHVSSAAWEVLALLCLARLPADVLVRDGGLRVVVFVRPPA